MEKSTVGCRFMEKSNIGGRLKKKKGKEEEEKKKEERRRSTWMSSSPACAARALATYGSIVSRCRPRDVAAIAARGRLSSPETSPCAGRETEA
ncbi:hypothetical protein B296_00045695, partial [Ensete ventricosum]